MMKNRMIKRFFLLILLILFTTLSMAGCSDESDYARITDVKYKAVVVDEPGCEGKVLITERLTFDVHADYESNLYWELWRDLPESYVDGVKVDYTVHSVKQILADGTEIVYEESPKLYWDDEDYVAENTTYGPGKWFHSKGPYDEDAAQYECVLFYIDGVYREEMVFEIQYEMHNASLRYNDCSDLYLAMYSGETIVHLESYEAEILFPNEDMPTPGNYQVTTYGTNANSFPVTESATANPGYYTFSFSLDEEDLQFKDYNQYIEFDLVSYGDDKHIFTEYANENRFTEDDVLEEILSDQEDYATAPARFQKIKTIVLILSIIISILTIASAPWMIRRQKKKFTFYESNETYHYYYDVPSELDPHFARAFVFCKDTAPDDLSGVYASLLLSLARKHYITMEDQTNGDVLIQLHKSEEPLTECEKLYYNLIVRHAGNAEQIFMNTLKDRVSMDYEHTESFTKNMKKALQTIGVKEGYFQNANYQQPKESLQGYAIFLLIIGICSLVLANPISSLTRLDLAFGAFFIFGITCIFVFLYLIKEADKYILLTQKGAIEYEKWRGFYRFLSDETQIQSRAHIDIVQMEHFLIYATAFNLAKNLNKTLNLHFPESADLQSQSIVHRRYYRSGRIYGHCHGFHSSVQTGASYGASGGSGYGGGGRGGGGGGGGH